MRLLNFVKEAGSKVVGKNNEEQAESIKNTIVKAIPEADNIKLKLDEGKLTIDGEVKNMEICEKIITIAGNHEGIAKVENNIKIEGLDIAEDKIKLYTVVKGDTLGGIAKKVYGDSSKYKQIFEFNQPMLKNPDLIYPGQVLRMPEL